MNTRFYNAKILTLADDHKFKITEGELWVKGNTICYIGDGTDTADVCKDGEVLVWDREIDACGNLLMPGFKNAHTHTAMTFLRSCFLLVLLMSIQKRTSWIRKTSVRWKCLVSWNI